MPIAAWVRSAEVTRSDEPLYQGPSTSESRRGAAARGARLPVFAAQRGPGCAGRFLQVGPLAWLCEEGAELSKFAPDEATDGVLPRSHNGLPYRYHFVGADGSFGYHSVQTAEDGVPDAQLLKGFGVAVVRVENNPEGNPFGLTTEDLWVPMRDLAPVAPFAFHGRELSGALNVAWVTRANALASPAPNKPKNAKLKLAKFQELVVLEEREVLGHRWFRFAPDFWLRLGYTWKDGNKAIADYGFAMYTTREVPSNDRSRSGLSDYRTSKTSAPGISSRLLPELLSEICILISSMSLRLCRRCLNTRRSSA